MHTAYIVQEGSANKPKSRLTLKVLCGSKAGSIYCSQPSTPGSGCRIQHQLGSWPLISLSTRGKTELHFRKQAAIKINLKKKKKKRYSPKRFNKTRPSPKKSKIAYTPYFKTYSSFSKQNEEAFSELKPLGKFLVTRGSSTCLDSYLSLQKSGA